MITLADILVATDFSEPSAAALTYGGALARHFTSTLHVVHIVGKMPSGFNGADGYLVSMPDLQQQVEDAARVELDALRIDADEPPLAIRRVLIAADVPAAAIVDYAKAAAHRSHHRRHTRTRRGGARVHRQRRRARRADRAVSGAHRPPSGTGVCGPRCRCHRHIEEDTMSIWFAIPIGVAVIVVLVSAVRRAGTSSVTALRLRR